MSSERTSLDARLSGPGHPSDPRGASFEVAEPDPEFAALPAPPRAERTAAVILMVLTAVAAAVMSLALLGEARYAFSAGHPQDVGDLASLQPGVELENRYIRTTGLLGTSGAIHYGRAAEADSFRVAPVAGNPTIWVEIRVPEGFEGPRFVPPTSFAGRLVPLPKAGIRHAGLAGSVREQTQVSVPEGAWLLIDGSSPRSSRWAVALVALFLGFAGWNLVGVFRVLRRVKDRHAES
ncbi:hypothetical protein [Chondromyces crocatus]|uniref:Uncharacterized protein n=1 Tax=Chondromyces crocatus TaxID=52 RepID=A0A0K1E5S7_CHOCO|nr:hypothetical protein [Chondromyces crocatus]AKT36194.1 uncharacterized protein CMC5_003080 [Chondromyces crocatus]